MIWIAKKEFGHENAVTMTGRAGMMSHPFLSFQNCHCCPTIISAMTMRVNPCEWACVFSFIWDSSSRNAFEFQ